MGKDSNKHILIIGGMGPQAGVFAHDLLIKEATRLGAADNEDYPRITHLSINVRDFISKPELKGAALKYILKCLADINVKTVDAAFIACNTAHILADDIANETGLPLISLVEETANCLSEQPGLTTVGVLATPSTVKGDLYGKALSENVEVLYPSGEASRQIEEVIRRVIAGDNDIELIDILADEIAELKKRGAQKVILGCTELSLLGSRIKDDDLMDPLKVVSIKVLEPGAKNE